MIPAIQTKVNGRNYRSLLEAKWATFFQLCDWKFEYEPFETNGWIPDFVLFGKDQNILVEIKPFSSLKEFENGTIKKIKQSVKNTPYLEMEILCIGIAPFNPYCMGDIAIGYLEDHLWNLDGDIDLWAPAILNCYNGRYGFFHQDQSYADRITGEYDGDHLLKTVSESEGMHLWNEACNKVQWNRTDK